MIKHLVNQKLGCIGFKYCNIDGEDEICSKGKYFLQWGEALHARESLLPKMKALMKRVITATPEEIKKHLNAVLKTSESLFADRMFLSTLPSEAQIAFRESEVGRRTNHKELPTTHRLMDEEANVNNIY